MKRIGYLHDKVYDIENKQEENEKLSEQPKDLVYETSEYSTFKIYEPKERLIFRLRYSSSKLILVLRIEVFIM